jgi:hypothetical protein
MRSFYLLDSIAAIRSIHDPYRLSYPYPFEFSPRHTFLHTDYFDNNARHQPLHLDSPKPWLVCVIISLFQQNQHLYKTSIIHNALACALLCAALTASASETSSENRTLAQTHAVGMCTSAFESIFFTSAVAPTGFSYPSVKVNNNERGVDQFNIQMKAIASFSSQPSMTFNYKCTFHIKGDRVFLDSESSLSGPN